MKINFGVKIVVLYLSFVALILILVSLCFNYKVDLVSKDYYAKELVFQNKLDASQRDAQLKKSISFNIIKNNIVFSLDSALLNKDVQGTITFYRPSNSALDIIKKINFVNGKQLIEISGFKKGFYKVQLDYEINKVKYYKENNLEFN